MQREEELLVRFAATRSPAAAEELARLCGPAIYATALGVLGNAHDAEDAAQEAALRLLRSAGTYRPGGSFRAWLYRVAVNAATDLLRAGRAAAAARSAGEDVMRRKTSEAPEELKSTVRAAVARLEEPQRTAVVLVYFQGLSRQEAAEVLGLPVNTVSSTLARAKDKLRERLSSVAALAVGLTVESLEPLLGGASQLEIPAQVAARLRAAVRAEAEKAGLSAASAAKGGIAMKVVLGVVLAGALAGIIGLIGPIRPMGSPPPAAKGKPVIEHFAFTETEGYLDGPRRESQGPARKGVAVDAKGNVYFAAVNNVASLRVARVDGTVETIAGDSGWGGSLPVEEGPAAFMGNLGYGTAIGRPSTAIAIKGLPLEGADKGFILISSGKCVLRDNCIYKVWKNKEKGGRWWFKLFAGKGSAVPPSAAGQSAPVADAKFRGFPIFGAGFDGNIYFHDRGYFYRLDDEKNTLTCLLAQEDYDAKVVDATGRKNPNGRGPEPDTILAAEDGGFYVGFYNGTYPRGWVFKVSADRKTVEPIATDAGGGLCDGPGLKTHYFGGPLLSKCCPKGNAFFGAIDDGVIRRWKDGRVTSLCRDGEWREFAKYGTWGGGDGDAGCLVNSKYKDTQAPYWGRGWVMPPIANPDYFYVTYTLGCGSGRLLRVGPVDFDKPTTGPLAGGN